MEEDLRAGNIVRGLSKRNKVAAWNECRRFTFAKRQLASSSAVRRRRGSDNHL